MAKKGKYIYDWPRAMVTVDAIVFSFRQNKARLLLVKRRNAPFKGQWGLPGGFVEMDEELSDAAARELAEETGLTNVPLSQMRTFGQCGRDPRGRTITIAFMGIAPPNHTRLKAGDDAAQAKWFDLEKLPCDMGFDHQQVIRLAVSRLKRKKAYRQNRTPSTNAITS